MVIVFENELFTFSICVRGYGLVIFNFYFKKLYKLKFLFSFLFLNLKMAMLLVHIRRVVLLLTISYLIEKIFKRLCSIFIIHRRSYSILTLRKKQLHFHLWLYLYVIYIYLLIINLIDWNNIVTINLFTLPPQTQ